MIFENSWVFVLLPAPIAIHFLVPARKVSRIAVRVPFFTRLDGQSESVSHRLGTWSSRSIQYAIWVFVMAALARPQRLEPPIEKRIPTRDLMLLVDLSGSMQQEDFRNAEGESTDRLSAVKQVLGDFLSKREGDRIGLVVFGNSPFLQVPFSSDLNLTRTLLEETTVGMAGPRTAFGDAIGLGIQLFEHSEVPEKVIIALTDGNDNASSVPPAEAAQIASDRKITIHTIGMGDPTTLGEEKLDADALREVARVTGGSDFLALDRDELEGVYERIDQIETKTLKTEGYRPKRDLFFWPLSIALFLSTCKFISAVWVVRSSTGTLDPEVRLRVNSRTFEMETSKA